MSRRTRSPAAAARGWLPGAAGGLLAGASLLAGLAHAGRPLATEDATTLPDGACQLEAWADRTRDGATFVHVEPACAILGVEWHLGGVRRFEGGRSATEAMVAQAKHVFRSVDDGAWGAGIVAGLLREPGREEESGWGDPYLIVPVSLAVGGEASSRVLVHLNAGVAHARFPARNVALWGAAVEVPAGARLTLVAESFGENASNPWFRAGGRYALSGDLDVDLTCSTQAGGTPRARFWSLGVHWAFGPSAP